MLSSIELLATEAGGGGFVVEHPPWLLENAWLFPLIPFVSFWLILFFGKRLPYKGSELGVGALVLTFAAAVAAVFQWTNLSPDEGHSEETAMGPLLAVAEEGGEAHGGPEAIVSTYTWWQSGGFEFEVGTMVDGLSVMMLFVVGMISLLVHIFSTDYVAGDRRFTHYFAFLSLFTAAMLLLVVSATTVQFITAWELVGVCSFVLIGHWWEDPKNSDAALKAFLTNRVGDIGLLIGMIILFFTAGHGETFGILETNIAAINHEASDTALTVAALCLLGAVMSKSGQFFLHTWLPDAMAGPTPVSALIHAATMVVAGVFLIARLYGVFWEGFHISGSSINVLAWTGAFTTVMAGALAFVQRDIKKVLAYSTVSQLGYMVLALGVGAWTAGVFHLFTHAFFKACLFLGAGSVSHACHHSFDMKADMGGLRKIMPRTFATFIIASIALAGLPPFAGFWSKDEILAGTGGFGFGGEGANGNYDLMLVMGGITALLTAAYMTRAIALTFFGEYRGHAHPHENGPRIVGPLIVLAVFAALIGFINLPAWFGDTPLTLLFEEWVEPAGRSYFPAISHAEFDPLLAILSIAAAVAGVLIAAAYYRRVFAENPAGTELENGPTKTNALARAGYTFLANKYYLDHLYTNVIAGGIKGPLAKLANTFNQKVLDGIVDGTATTARHAAYFVYDFFDQKVVDGVVNGSGISAGESGQFLRRIQTGKVQQYAALMFAGATVLAGMFIVFI